MIFDFMLGWSQIKQKIAIFRKSKSLNPHAAAVLGSGLTLTCLALEILRIAAQINRIHWELLPLATFSKIWKEDMFAFTGLCRYQFNSWSVPLQNSPKRNCRCWSSLPLSGPAAAIHEHMSSEHLSPIRNNPQCQIIPNTSHLSMGQCQLQMVICFLVM